MSFIYTYFFVEHKKSNLWIYGYPTVLFHTMKVNEIGSVKHQVTKKSRKSSSYNLNYSRYCEPEYKVTQIRFDSRGEYF